ncbi:primase-like DNA-binding domain-containing protein [Pantoea sp. S18]|uniref:DNA primase family protein n=1 Tax=Pantoea sp. S18 TaxID=3019892 RepID=UPI002B1F7B3D|nr:primase-like DNA-binding domain-containing protein [Pantoea sp. S18]MEA5105179.1 primase-like DNA-binding domain-containing protein [Pantoea sp. S18]
MTDSILQHEAMSDALFSCVYKWVNGHNLDKKEAAAAAARHQDKSSAYGVLAGQLKKLVVGHGVTPDELIQRGLLLTDSAKQKENRIRLVAGLIGEDGIKSVLTDSDRANRLWPLPKPDKKKRVTDAATSSLAQMGPSQRGEVLLSHYDGLLSLQGDSDIVHHYNGIFWEPVSDKSLAREMAAVFIESGVPYSMTAMKNTVDTMKLSLPVMGSTERHLIGFRNGVFDTRKGAFREHKKDDWLLMASGVDFIPAAEGESLQTHAPAFWKWLSWSTGGNQRKADRVLAALYMVMANRYDWQLFLEVTGAGGSGKSVMAEVCTMLAGKVNTVSASMKALEEPRERALLVGFSLIIMPDMTRYAGDGAGIKAITGGDKVAIDPKHKPPYSTRIPAVVLAVNNNAMTFSDRSGGISRRRVIFNFSQVVPECERDPLLTEKIEAELPVIIRHMLERFAVQSDAKHLLFEQQKSEEALAIKRDGDSLVDFCGYLMASVACDGMLIGNADITPFRPRRYLYHAYLQFMRSNGLSKPVSLTRFGTDMPGAMAEYGNVYERKKTKQGMRSNLLLNPDTNEWMPQCDEPDSEI